ncbi:ferritin family protein [Streptomyces chrestomyceticus]|uniref:ferritin family protein n=1 Tax=Streptomyces chrestomyceticus TaxID=68185 RepID=UPI0004C79ADE
MPQPSESLAAELRAVFAAEATTALRYAYFAQIAETEGHTQIAELFTDLADSITCAAHGHLDVLRDATLATGFRDVGDTPLNLASSVTAALEQSGETYPRLTAAALDEGGADLASWLTTLMALKKKHTARLDAALQEMARHSDEPAGDPALTGVRNDR